MSNKKRTWSATLKNFWVDLILFLAFIIDWNLRFTGLAVHEWLGIGLIALFIYHILLHWRWIGAVTRRLTQRLPAVERIKYAVDLLLYLDMVILVASGIWISEVALRQLGVTVAPSGFWRWLHHASADWALWLVGLHLALSWQWIVECTRRYLGQPLLRLGRFGSKRVESAPAEVVQ
jgi:Domain of unknown function (DUF4405)